MPYVPGDSSNATVDSLLTDREDMLKMLRFHLQRAQERMVQAANKKRTERNFEIGEFVSLKLQPYKQQTLKNHTNQKLSPKYCGPYRVLDKVGAVAYCLELLPEATIHSTFHVSQLKKYHGPLPNSSEILAIYTEEALEPL